jgi:hypothetical protein
MRCRENVIEHRLTKVKHSWSFEERELVQWTNSPRNGQVERIKRTIKEATVKRFHYGEHHQFETHLADFVAAYNFGRRLKTLRGLTPYEFICKCWTSEPERFTIDLIHQMPGLNT